MSPAAHRHFIDARILDLRPTQMTAGFAEVALKRREWAGLSKKNRKELLSSHWFPAVPGPRLREARGLARSPLARYLPGWSGITVAAADLRR
jgi:hypothetical protein